MKKKASRGYPSGVYCQDSASRRSRRNRRIWASAISTASSSLLGDTVELNEHRGTSPWLSTVPDSTRMSRASMLPMAVARPAPLPADPILEALDRAPMGEPFTPDQRAELDQAMAEVAAGRVKLISNEDVPAWLEAKARAATTNPPAIPLAHSSILSVTLYGASDRLYSVRYQRGRQRTRAAGQPGNHAELLSLVGQQSHPRSKRIANLSRSSVF